MAKEEPQEKRVIQREAIFDFSELYNQMKYFFDKNHYNFHEKAHEQKESDSGMEIEIAWSAEREVTNYFKFKIDILIIGTSIDKLQTEEGHIVYKGDLKIIVDGKLIMDHKDKFEGSKFTEFAGKIYDDILIKKKHDIYEKKLDDEIEEVLYLIKEHLELYS